MDEVISGMAFGPSVRCTCCATSHANPEPSIKASYCSLRQITNQTPNVAYIGSGFYVKARSR
jgi:hypothetical protein